MTRLGRSFRPRARHRVRQAVGSDAGISLVEVLAASVVLAIAVIGVATMFGRGSAFVAASGADRVAAGLAQDRIERIRANGWSALGTTAQPVGQPFSDPTLDTSIRAGSNHVFDRAVCIQYVDPTTAEGVIGPPYDPSCPPGSATTMVRITVIVTSPQPEVGAITLQAWMTQEGS